LPARPAVPGDRQGFTPTDDRSEFKVTVRGPEGSGLAATTCILGRIAAGCGSFEVLDTLTTVGASAGGGAGRDDGRGSAPSVNAGRST
jgi:multidrug efflux pump subunit AcrB